MNNRKIQVIITVVGFIFHFIMIKLGYDKTHEFAVTFVKILLCIAFVLITIKGWKNEL